MIAFVKYSELLDVTETARVTFGVCACHWLVSQRELQSSSGHEPNNLVEMRYGDGTFEYLYLYFEDEICEVVDVTRVVPRTAGRLHFRSIKVEEMSDDLSHAFATYRKAANAYIVLERFPWNSTVSKAGIVPQRTQITIPESKRIQLDGGLSFQFDGIRRFLSLPSDSDSPPVAIDINDEGIRWCFDES